MFWIPVAAPKDKRTHIRAGLVYVACMSVVVLTAFSMSGLTFADPFGVRGITQPMPAQQATDFIRTSRLFATFLAYLAGLTLASGWHGVWVVRTRREPTSFRTPFNLALNAALVVAALVVLGIGVRYRIAAFIGLSPVGLLVGGGHLSYLLRGPQTRMAWWYEHLGSMIGTGIAGYTAFLVFGGAHLFPALRNSQFFVAFWLLPTVLGTPAVFLTVAHYKRKLERQAVGDEQFSSGRSCVATHQSDTHNRDGGNEPLWQLAPPQPLSCPIANSSHLCATP